jgi:hypothetical protein
MTDFNNIARAQGQVQQGQQFYDAQRYRSMDQTGATVERAGQQANQDIWRGRQMDLQQQQLQAQMQSVQQELAIRQTDANMRLQEHEITQQINATKLQMMQAIDATDLGRAQVRAATAAADMQELQAKKARKEFDESDAMNQREWQVREFKARFPDGPRSVFEAGYVVDPGTALGYRLPKDDAELKAFGGRIDQSRERAASGGSGTTAFNSERNYLSSVISAAERAGDLDLRDQALARQRGQDPGLAAGQQGDAPAAPPAKPAAEVSGPERALAQRLSAPGVASMIDGIADGIGVSAVRMPPQQAERAAAALFSNRAEVVAAVRASGGEGGRRAGQSDDEIMSEIANALASTQQSGMKFDALAFLVRKGVVTPDQAQQMWGSK